jgi:hypothetical protein
MLDLAGKFGVKYEMDSNDAILLERNLNKIEREINQVKGTIGWLWGTGDLKQRQFCVNRVQDETGQTIANEDLPEDLKKEETKLIGKRGDDK